jgi:hypothetical protein
VAGGGFKGGIVYGSSAEYGLKIASSPVHIHDLQATLLNQLGLDHTAHIPSCRARLQANGRFRPGHKGRARLMKLSLA